MNEKRKFTASLEQWAVVYDPVDNGSSLPPEMKKICLYGTISGHPLFLNGTVVITSPITAVDGIRITVAGVSECYDVLLGQVHPDLARFTLTLKWLKENHLTWDQLSGEAKEKIELLLKLLGEPPMTLNGGLEPL